jgi:hypothetical protein
MKCPHCGKKLEDDMLLERIDPAKIVSAANRMMGRRGRGPVKARSPEQARAAAQTRWANAKAN